MGFWGRPILKTAKRAKQSESCVTRVQTHDFLSIFRDPPDPNSLRSASAGFRRHESARIYGGSDGGA
ncbi:hypothetical protein U1Q18_036711, partial [Sarracenia purpurea var. burkii]